MTVSKHYLDKRAHRILADIPDGGDDSLLDTREVADLFGVSVAWLEIGRMAAYDYGPPFIRVSPRMIRYRRGDLRRWLEERASAREAA